MNALSRVVELTTKNFDKVLKSTGKLFVDFWAPWCKPCIRMNPLIERMADKHSSITFAKVNVEDEGELATRYHISSLPAYMMFNDSIPSVSKIGAVSEQELEQLIFEYA